MWFSGIIRTHKILLRLRALDRWSQVHGENFSCYNYGAAARACMHDDNNFIMIIINIL